MRLRIYPTISTAILTVILSPLSGAAQNIRVNASKRSSQIPKVCEGVGPARVEDPADVKALIKEARCKGAGDMLIEYTYVMNAKTRADKQGQRQDSTTYEVFIPTLKSGMKTKGILLVTSRNGVPVPPGELEKQRLKTGERLEKEESKIAHAEVAAPSKNADRPTGLLPLGMYSSTSINRGSHGGVRLAIDDFLVACDFTLLRRAQEDGRDILILGFTPRPDATLSEHEKYIARLTGEIWIDATDRIVTRLSGWPVSTASHSPESRAVYVEMTRLQEGVWVPRGVRINGLDYQDLFDHVTADSVWTFSNYIRFSTEIKDVNVNPVSKP